MTDRDFKLLVREYFQQLSKMAHSRYIYHADETDKLDALSKKIISELKRFTKQEMESLPFKG